MLVAEEAVEIRVLKRQGKSIREIARMLDVSRNMVRRYLRGEGLPRYEREARPSKLDPYKHYIDERVKAGRRTGFRRPCCCASCEALGCGRVQHTQSACRARGAPKRCRVTGITIEQLRRSTVRTPRRTSS
jgi:transposase